MNKIYKLYIILFFCFVSVNAFAEREAQSVEEKELLEAVSEDFTTLAERLISENVAVDITDIYGQSLLMFAARNNNKKLVELLIKKGADPNLKITPPESINEGRSGIRMLFLVGLSVLDFGVKTKDTEMVDLLMKLGAKLDVKNKEIDSAVAHASLDNNVMMVNYLLGKGARVSDETGQSLVVMHIQRNAPSMYGSSRGGGIKLFPLIKVWDDYGIPLDDEVLLQSRFLEKKRDKNLLVGYMGEYRKWLEDGAKLPKQIERQVQAKPMPKIMNEAEMDSILAAAKYRAENQEPYKTEQEILEEEYDNLIRNTLIFVLIVALLAIPFIYRKKIVAFWKQHYNVKYTFSKTWILNRTKGKNPRVNKARENILNPINAIKKKDSGGFEKGWTVDDTIKIEVNYLTIEDMINPIRMQNEHERAVRDMIWYIRRLEQMSDIEASKSLGSKGLLPKLESLKVSIKSTNVRSVYKRSLFILVENYSKNDKKVQLFLKKSQWEK